MIVTRPSFKWITVGVWLMPLTFAATAVCLLGAFWRELMLRWQSREVGWMPQSAIGWLWWAVMGLGAVSTVFSVRPLESIFGWLAGLGYLITFVVATWTIVTPGRLKQLHKSLFWLAVTLSAVGLAIYVSNLHYVWHFSPELEIKIGTADRRINSVMYHPNLLAGFLVLALSCGLGLFHQSAAWQRRVVYAGGLLTLGTCLVLTSSRSGWIGAGVLLLAFGIFVHRGWLFALIGSAAAAFAVFPDLILSRLMALSWENPAFDKFRVMGWMSAIEMIKQRPLTGWGPSTWPVVYPQFRLPEETHHLPHAHNYYLHVAVEFGIPVVLALMAIIVFVCVRGALATRHTQYHLPVLATLCGVAGYLVVNLFDFTLSEGRNAMAFFLLVGGVEAARRMAIADRPPELRRILPQAVSPQSPTRHPEEPIQ